jgi:hypothetical protein
MPDITDNPLDGRGAARAAVLPAAIWTARADWIDAEDGTIVAMKPPTDLPTSAALWPSRRPVIAAAPTMLAALRLALPELREDLETLVECGTVGAPDWSANTPLPANMDQEVRHIAETKKAAYDAVVAAIAAAEAR